MGKHVGLRHDSAAHKVLCRLVDLGGTANAITLMGVLSAEFRSYSRFKDRVSDVLELHCLAIVINDTFSATPLGKDYIAECEGRILPAWPKYVGQIVPAHVPQPFQPLNPKYITALPMREGAFAYRDIPSLIGSKRVLPNGEIIK